MIADIMPSHSAPHLCRDWIANRTRHVRVWQGIEIAIEEEGWKIVGLLRLAPLIPYNILNYALGLTAVKFWAYFFASAVGILPGTLLYVSLGSVAGDITKITSGTEGANKTSEYHHIITFCSFLTDPL